MSGLVEKSAKPCLFLPFLAIKDHGSSQLQLFQLGGLANLSHGIPARAKLSALPAALFLVFAAQLSDDHFLPGFCALSDFFQKMAGSC